MEKFSESKIRYLEMIQSIISRMASNSFLLKGWMITLVSGIFVLTFEKGNILVILIFVPIIVFWLFDSYYLQLERRYRELYKSIISIDNNSITFNLTAPAPEKKVGTTYYNCLFSKSEVYFYAPVLICAIVISVFLMI